MEYQVIWQIRLSHGFTDGREVWPFDTEGRYCSANTGSVAVDKYGGSLTSLNASKVRDAGDGRSARVIRCDRASRHLMQRRHVSRYASEMLVDNSCSNVLSHLHRPGCSECHNLRSDTDLRRVQLDFPSIEKRSRAALSTTYPDRRKGAADLTG